VATVFRFTRRLGVSTLADRVRVANPVSLFICDIALLSNRNAAANLHNRPFGFVQEAKTRKKKNVDSNCLDVTIQSNLKPLSHGMLHFQINTHSGVPVYRQMIDQIKYYVASDALKAGDQLPSIRELAQSLAINPTTVVRVYTELEREGVIEMRHGKGAFVTDSGRRMTAAERDKTLRLLARQLAVEATQMGAPASQVLKVVREELADLQDAEEVGAPVKVSVVRR